MIRPQAHSHFTSFSMARHTRSVLLAWRAGEGYDPRLIAETAAGLHAVVRKYLLESGVFDPTDSRHCEWIGLRKDTLGGHLRWALREKYLVDFSNGDWWQLLQLRHEVAPFTDAQTLAHVERVAADWVYATMLSPALILSSRGAVSEWWIDCVRDKTTLLAPSWLVHGVLHRTLTERMSAHLNVPPALLELEVLNSRGQTDPEQFLGESYGAFTCRSRPVSGGH